MFYALGNKDTIESSLKSQKSADTTEFSGKPSESETASNSSLLDSGDKMACSKLW